MTESKAHLDLIKKLYTIICNREDITPDLVMAEDHEHNTVTISTPDGYRPDVYYDDGECVIIGEAKTTDDLWNNHSHAQLESYLRYLQAYAQQKKVILYLGVPWTEVKSIARFLRKKKMEYSEIEIRIINEIGLGETI